ncbi:MAG: hypothetical protein R6W31_12920, partial [Bacteroidales bacterium]
MKKKRSCAKKYFTGPKYFIWIFLLNTSIALSQDTILKPFFIEDFNSLKSVRPESNLLICKQDSLIIDRIIENKPNELRIGIPFNDHLQDINLRRHNILSDDVKVVTVNENNEEVVVSSIFDFVSYYGFMNGDKGSLVSLNISPHSSFGLFQDNFQSISLLATNRRIRHPLAEASCEQRAISCSIEGDEHDPLKNNDPAKEISDYLGSGRVRMSYEGEDLLEVEVAVEADYELY